MTAAQSDHIAATVLITVALAWVAVWLLLHLTRYLRDLRAYHAAEQEDADNQARWDLDEDGWADWFGALSDAERVRAAKRIRDLAFGYDVDATPIFDDLAAEYLRAELDAWGQP